ncbi:hypothetical protein ACVWXM_002025 [Bradyrhizobium sp. GM7.3]
MLRTSSLAKKSKLIYRHPHQSKSLFHRVATFTPRHWHDPHDLNARAANKRADAAKGPRKGAADQPLKQAEAKRCRSDGLDPLLRKLNLSPPCDS